jgi:hypothetical protein
MRSNGPKHCREWERKGKKLSENEFYGKKKEGWGRGGSERTLSPLLGRLRLSLFIESSRVCSISVVVVGPYALGWEPRRRELGKSMWSRETPSRHHPPLLILFCRTRERERKESESPRLEPAAEPCGCGIRVRRRYKYRSTPLLYSAPSRPHSRHETRKIVKHVQKRLLLLDLDPPTRGQGTF